MISGDVTALHSLLFRHVLGYSFQPFQGWLYHLNMYPLHTANSRRNYRLVVDKNDNEVDDKLRKYCHTF